MGRNEDEYNASYNAARSGGFWDDVAEGFGNHETINHKGYLDGARDREKYGRRDNPNSLFKNKPNSDTSRSREVDDDDRDSMLEALAHKIVEDRKIDELVRDATRASPEVQRRFLRKTIACTMIKDYSADCDKCNDTLDRAVNRGLALTDNKEEIYSTILRAYLNKRSDG